MVRAPDYWLRAKGKAMKKKSTTSNEASVRLVPTLTLAMRERLRKAIAEEERPEVIAATKQQAREAFARLDAEEAQIADIVAAISAERDRQNLSLENIKARTGIDRANLSRLFSGAGSPTLDTLKKLANAVGKRLNVTLSEK